MKNSAYSSLKSILLIGYSESFGGRLQNYFRDIAPSANIDEYNIADGCPDSNYDWKQYQLVIIDYDLGENENGLEWIRSCRASYDFPTVMQK